MEEFKISLFEHEHAIRFPKYRTLQDHECQVLLAAIIKRYNLSESNVACELASIQSYFNELNAGEDGFALLTFLTALSIEPLSEVFINWNRFEQIDVFGIEELAQYFDDIWFPGADDIDLFDTSLSWIVSIRHDGIMSFVK